MRISLVLIVILAALACSGCASQSNLRQSEIADRYQADAVYMARVEHLARERGIGVQWVNPPLSRGEPKSRSVDGD